MAITRSQTAAGSAGAAPPPPPPPPPPPKTTRKPGGPGRGRPRKTPKPAATAPKSTAIKKKQPSGKKTSSQKPSDKTSTHRPTNPRADLASLLLTNAYNTTVSPLLSTLSKAARLDSQTTYGEQSPAFISGMLAEFGVTADSSFVDLGSGVGNVVLQAYLETGCCSLGCELDAGRHRAASAFLDAIAAALDGVSPDTAPEGFKTASQRDEAGFGSADELRRRAILRRGDIFEDWVTVARVFGADLIFCDNFKFGSEIVARQVEAVLRPMKPGAVFVSLERVVRGTRGACRKVLQELGVEEEKRVSERGAVSWTDSPIEYWVYRK